MEWIIIGIVVAVFLIVLIANIKIVPQRAPSCGETWHLSRDMAYRSALEGSVCGKNRKENLPYGAGCGFSAAGRYHEDNVRMQIDTVVFYQITDCKLFTYGVESPIAAIENLTATTLRNIIGELELDSTLTSRDVINTKMRAILDEATDPWGIKVNRVELKNIIPPREIQDAMEKQMKAERERREQILRAEGEKNSTILVAEGKKQAMILDAEAQKQRQILLAEAEKEARIRAAEGEAEAILKVQEATAESIKKINEADPSDKVIAIKSLEAFEKAADGKATKSSSRVKSSRLRVLPRASRRSLPMRQKAKKQLQNNENSKKISSYKKARQKCLAFLYVCRAPILSIKAQGHLYLSLARVQKGTKLRIRKPLNSPKARVRPAVFAVK